MHATRKGESPWMAAWRQIQHDEASNIIGDKLPAKVAEIRTRWSDVRNIASTSFSEREWDSSKMQVHEKNLAGRCTSCHRPYI